MPAPAPQKVAPTAKIPDDAPIAPPTRPGPSAQHPNVSYAPPAMPTPAPGALQAPQVPPTSQGRPSPAPALAASRAPVDASGSSFVAPAQTPLGLIAIVMLVDLVLAGTGAFLLARGLSKPASAASKEEPKGEAPPAKASEAAPPPAAPAPAPAPATPTPPAPAPAAPETAAAEPPPAKTEKPATTETPASARRPATPAATKPSTETEIATKVMGSRIAFGQCREQAGEVHGNIEIAFRVLGDGSVSNVSVVEDTTGNPSLAPCLRDTIATWKVTPHNGAPLSFVRPFNYP